jgi:hypothetical protein
MFERILPVFLCLMLPLVGCSHSYDGTVIIPKPLDARRFWDKPPQQAQDEPSLPEIAVFPVAPETPNRFAARRTVAAPARYMTRPNNPPLLSSEPANPLTCRDVSEAGKRIRMVCE